jgi:V/A-type H+-transporting ATPase subunit C
VDIEQIKASLMPLGYLSETELEALARAGDARGVVDTLRTWESPYAAPLRDGWAAYHTSGDLSDLELELDKYWAAHTAQTLSKRRNNYQVARRVFGTQIDVLNLVMVFRLLRADADQVRAERYYLDGGRYIHGDLFVELSHLSDVDEVLDRLRRTPYADALDNAAMRYLEFNSISVFERAMEMKLLRQAMLTGVRDPQGIGVPITYLYAKQNEVTNLRIIIQGKAVGMPAERVREDLILV